MMPNRQCRLVILVIVVHLFLLGLSCRDENPISFIWIPFTRASSKTALSNAPAVFERVYAPPTHAAECRTRSPMCALCDVRIEKTTEPNVESESKPPFQFAGFRPFSAPKLSAHERI